MFVVYLLTRFSLCKYFTKDSHISQLRVFLTHRILTEWSFIISAQRLICYLSIIINAGAAAGDRHQRFGVRQRISAACPNTIAR